MHLTLAYAWADNGNTAAAVAEAKQAIQLDSENQEARDMLPLIESGSARCTIFLMGRHDLDLDAGHENGWLVYFNQLYLWRNRGNYLVDPLANQSKPNWSTSESIPELMAAAGRWFRKLSFLSKRGARRPRVLMAPRANNPVDMRVQGTSLVSRTFLDAEELTVDTSPLERAA